MAAYNGQEHVQWPEHVSLDYTEDIAVKLMINNGHTGVVNFAYALKNRKVPVTLSALLQEERERGNNHYGYQEVGNVSVDEDIAVKTMINREYSGVVHCACNLKERGLPITVSNLYEELHITGRLQQHRVLRTHE